MGVDLYDTLGTERGSSKKQINSAFKKMMVVHHPDKNGGKQTPEFDSIKRAYDTLNNEETRRMYDEFGVIPGDDESNRRMISIASLCQIFAGIVTGIEFEELERMDLIGTMRTQIVASKQASMAQKSDMEKRLKKFTKAHHVMKKRLKHKAKTGDDFLMKAIEENIRQFPSNIINVEKQIAQHDEMLAMLKEYQYEYEHVSMTNRMEEARRAQFDIMKIMMSGGI